MSVRCPSCLATIKFGQILWWCNCLGGRYHARLERPSTGFAEMLENGVPCGVQNCGKQLVELAVEKCGRVLPVRMLDQGVRQAFCIVVGIGQNSHSAADNAAALLVWRMKAARLRAAMRWVHANDETHRIWQMGPNLGKHLGNRFGREPLLIAMVDAATMRSQAQAVVLVRSFHDHGDDLAAWLSAPNCVRSAGTASASRLGDADQIVLAVRADDLNGEESRQKVSEHASAVAKALSSHDRGARGRSAMDPRLFLLLVDQERRFLLSLGRGTATPELCAVNGGSAAWQPIAYGYVFDNYRLAELFAAGQPGLDRRLITPLYGSMPVGDEPSLLGIEPWSEHLLSLLAAGDVQDGSRIERT